MDRSCTRYPVIGHVTWRMRSDRCIYGNGNVVRSFSPTSYDRLIFMNYD